MRALESSTGVRDPHTPRSYHVRPDGTFHRDLASRDLRHIVATSTGHLWMDVDATNRGQVELLESLCGFHPLSLEDALNAQSRGKIEEYAGYLFLIVRGPLAAGSRRSWQAVMASLVAWFVPGTLFSIASGVWQNVVLNLLFMTAYAAPLAATYPSHGGRGHAAAETLRKDRDD